MGGGTWGLFHQVSELFEIDGVPFAVVVAHAFGGFQDFWDFVEGGFADEGAEAFEADFAQADVFVTVDAAAQFFL